MRILTVNQMREAERQATELGLSEALLQARAGSAVARQTAHLCPAGSLLVFAGRGNNGRDAWIAARELQRQGRRVTLYVLPDSAIQPPELAASVADGAATSPGG